MHGLGTRMRAALLGSMLLTFGCGVARPALAQDLGLATKYTAVTVNPEPTAAGQLGWLGVANGGDLNGDRRDDILVPQYSGNGAIFVVSGADGAVLRKLLFPDAATSTVGSSGNFVYPARIADLTSCPGGVANQPCPALGGGDGVPETVVGATGTDIAGAAPDMGRAYVFDGATGALLKRVQMPAADLASEAAQFPSGKGFSFGRSVLSPASEFPVNAPATVKLGDLDGGGKADFVIGNPTFYEAGPATNASCNPGPCPGSGRVYFYRGEDVAGGDPSAILDTPFRIVRNPQAESDPTHERFGHATMPVGDLGRCTASAGEGLPCTTSSTAADARPEVVVAAHQASADGGVKAGIAFLLDGATGSVLRRYSHPEPQAGALFGYAVGTMSTAIGDVGGSSLPDILIPAVAQNTGALGAGRAYVMTGDFRASAPLLSWLDGPTPDRGENFGAPFSGVGNVAGDAKNEILVGNAGPWVPGDNGSFEGSLNIVDAVTQRVVQTISDPDGQPGSGFGQGAIEIGDVNADGMMDFAATAGFWSGGTLPREGRLYILRSDTSPAPAAPAPVPPVAAPGPQGPPGPPGAAPVTSIVQAPAGRTLELAASRSAVRRGGRVRLRGVLEAFSNRASCTRGIRVRLQRRAPSASRYRTFTSARTTTTGAFSVSVRPTRTTIFRAVVEQTSSCAGAASNRERVRVTARRGRR